MSKTWHSYTEPPEPLTWVMLRFGDGGERDAKGFYRGMHGAYYTSTEAMQRGQAVHPTHWAKIEVMQ